MKPNNEARVQLTYPRSNADDFKPCVCLRIEDGPSGEVLFDAEIPAEQWVQLLSSCGERIKGFTTTKTERIGKKMVCEKFFFKVRDGDNKFRDGKFPAWLGPEIDRLIVSWDSVDTPHRNNNRQWVLVARKWVDEKETK